MPCGLEGNIKITNQVLYTSGSQPVVHVPLGVCSGPVGGYTKIKLVMAENIKKKGVKLNTKTKL
jgi:hypothetical protein